MESSHSVEMRSVLSIAIPRSSDTPLRLEARPFPHSFLRSTLSRQRAGSVLAEQGAFDEVPILNPLLAVIVALPRDMIGAAEERSPNATVDAVIGVKSPVSPFRDRQELQLASAHERKLRRFPKRPAIYGWHSAWIPPGDSARTASILSCVIDLGANGQVTRCRQKASWNEERWRPGHRRGENGSPSRLRSPSREFTGRKWEGKSHWRGRPACNCGLHQSRWSPANLFFPRGALANANMSPKVMSACQAPTR